LPVLKKGYPPEIESSNLILARNLTLANSFSIESEKGVVLSSANVVKDGVVDNMGNKLAPILYSKIFNIFGFNKDLPLYVTIFLFTSANLIFFFLIYKKFNFLIASIFSFFFILMPIVWRGALMPGFYEFAVFFFAGALFFYFYNEKSNWFFLILASIFFGLAVSSRNVFLLSFVPIVFFDFYRFRSLKRLFLLITPFVIIFYIFVGITVFANLDESNRPYFASYSHAFPDPYTYYFDRDEYVNEILDQSRGDVSLYLADYGYKISLNQRLLAFIGSIKYYLREFMQIIYFGGPLILWLAFLGIVYLYKDNKLLLKLFIFWPIFLFTVLILLCTTNWDHLLEILLPMILFIALGLSWLIKIIFDLNLNKKLKIAIIIILIFGLAGHFINCNKWMFHEEYATGLMGETMAEVELINKIGLTNDDVIAYPGHPTAMYNINYYTDKNIVRFDPETIKKLINQGKLKSAFDYFGVTRIISYDEELTQEIINSTEAKEITAER
jgi:hypothetical protein